MNGQHPAVQVCHRLLSYSLILILRVNVLEYLFGSQGDSIDVVSLEPQARGVVILVVCDVNLVFSEILLLFFLVFIACYLNETVLIFTCGLLNVLICQLGNTS